MSVLTGKICGCLFSFDHFGDHRKSGQVDPDKTELAQANFLFAATQLTTKWHNIEYLGPISCTCRDPSFKEQETFKKYFVTPEKLEHFLQHHAKFSIACLQFVRCTFSISDYIEKIKPIKKKSKHNDYNDTMDIDIDDEYDNVNRDNIDNNVNHIHIDNDLNRNDIDMDIDMDNNDVNRDDTDIDIDIDNNDVNRDDIDIDMNIDYNSNNNNNNNNRYNFRSRSKHKIRQKFIDGNHQFTHNEKLKFFMKKDDQKPCVYCSKHYIRSPYFKVVPNRFINPPTIVYYDKIKHKFTRADPKKLLRSQFKCLLPWLSLQKNPLSLSSNSIYDLYNPILSFTDLVAVCCPYCGSSQYRVTKSLLLRHLQYYHFESGNHSSLSRHFKNQLNKVHKDVKLEKQWFQDNIRVVLNHWKNEYLVINYFNEYEWMEIAENHPKVIRYREYISNREPVQTQPNEFWPSITRKNEIRFWGSGYLDPELLIKLKQFKFMDSNWLKCVEKNQIERETIQNKLIERKIKYKLSKPYWCFCLKNLDHTRYVMKKCSLCGGWWHPKCLNKNKKELIALKLWYCPYCDLNHTFGNYVQRIQQTQTVPMKADEKKKIAKIAAKN